MAVEVVLVLGGEDVVGTAHRPAEDGILLHLPKPARFSMRVGQGAQAWLRLAFVMQ